MALYFLLPGLVILARILIGLDRKANRTSFFVFVVVLTLWVGFRFDVGCDWNSYLRYERAAGFMTYREAFLSRDPLFYATTKLLGTMGIPFYPGINVVTALIFFGGAASL